MAQEDSTVIVAAPEEGEFLKTSWELVVVRNDGGHCRLPVHRSIQRLDLGDGLRLLFTCRASALLFSEESSPGMLFHQRRASSSGELRVGERLQWPGGQITLLDRSGVVRATLECYSEPFYARIWPLDQRTTSIGRPGRRRNDVVLDHPTISREHATLAWGEPGPSLRSDTGRGLVLVNGQKVTAEEHCNLEDGSLLQLGELLFQFRLLQEPGLEPPPDVRMHATSLGGFRVRLGREFVPETAWRTQAVRWLLARLCLAWGRSLPVAQLQEEFWPDRPHASSKNNLNYTVSVLRSTLKQHQAEEYLLRGSGCLQLNPELLGEHDVVRLQSYLQEREDPRAWEKAVELYSGPYLQGCYLDWAVETGERLQREVLRVGHKLLAAYETQSRFEDGLALATRLLEWEPLDGQLHLALMRIFAATGQGPEAARQFQRYQEGLRRELNLEPEAEVAQQYEKLRAMLSL